MNTPNTWLHRVVAFIKRRGAEQAERDDPYYQWLVEQQDAACKSAAMLKEAREHHALIRALRHENRMGGTP